MKHARLLSWISLTALLFPGWSGRAQTLTVTNNLVLWLKADSLTNTLSEGQAVTAWADSSGSGNNTSTVASNAPVFHASLFNGLPGLTFNGTSNFLGLTRVSLPAGLTYVAVFRTTNTDSTRDYPLNAPLTLIGDHTGLIQNGFGVGAGRGEYNNFTGANNRLTGATVVNDGFPQVLALTHGSNAPGPINMYVKGLLDGSTNSAYNSTFIGFDRIGGGVNISPCCVGTADFFQGDVAEVLVYSTVLSGSQRWDAYEYLVAKYAIPEPGTMGLVLAGAALLWRRRGKWQYGVSE